MKAKTHYSLEKMPNKRLKHRAFHALDSQQVARRLGERYVSGIKMKIRFVYLTFFLLILYSVSAYFFPNYLLQNIFLTDRSFETSQKFVSVLSNAIDESKAPLSKEMALSLVSEISKKESQKHRDLQNFAELAQYHSIILMGLMLLHLGALLRFLRANNET
ncbi:hypothetical protein [Shewanella sedimentimangrovi]|uniref:Uncharacterized protein n=1 Tax=Shewanella sedimentimangrovi TaxID=2814293 RepID=A0ABX7R4L0_9GAMM|nr:hypothetical protein [Shewanella sedimentimangrovi]QSX38419.1 hypothetical protein JYB85_06250 [Shewanella sedimentimangrovi]